jgi:hypothetical protein
VVLVKHSFVDEITNPKSYLGKLAGKELQIKEPTRIDPALRYLAVMNSLNTRQCEGNETHER